LKWRLLFEGWLCTIRFILLLCLCEFSYKLYYIQCVIFWVHENLWGRLCLWNFIILNCCNLRFFSILNYTHILAPLILRSDIFHIEQYVWEIKISLLFDYWYLLVVLLLNFVCWYITAFLPGALPLEDVTFRLWS
jgi:hypothetical protein